MSRIFALYSCIAAAGDAALSSGALVAQALRRFLHQLPQGDLKTA